MPHSLLLPLVLLVAMTAGKAMWRDRPDAAAQEIATAAKQFLALLDNNQRSLAQREPQDAEHLRWAFVPGRYPGIELGALSPVQKESAQALLQAMLSAAGFRKVTAIFSLESVLAELESEQGRDVSHRDANRYALLVFGAPEPAGTFTVRLQGHHVSLQVGVLHGKFHHAAPRFLGANPHELTRGSHRGQRVFGAEEDLARALLLLLDEPQLARAVISQEAPADVLLGPGVAPAALGQRAGIAWRDLNEVQRGVLWRLLETHAEVLRADAAAAELARIAAGDRDAMCFAWAGGMQRGQGHYYRIHGVDFAVEYDNTQNGANHVHQVWRDFTRDFGGDALARHLAEQHGR